jgi:hypothetical protein
VSWDFNCRLLSVLITLALVAVVPQYSYWLALLIGLGFTHYALSFYYARSRIRELGTSSNHLIPLVGLAGLFALFYLLEFPLEVYFGLHHAFNEAYLKRGNQESKGNTEIAAQRCLLHLAVYFCILRGDAHLTQIPQWLTWGFALFAIFVYGRQVQTLAREKGAAIAWSQHSIELGLIAVLALSLLFKITFFQIVFYHFILWTLLPLPMMKQKGDGALQQYLMLTAAGLLLYFGVLIVFAPNQFSAVLVLMLSQFYLWSYIHITASMALSTAHPRWIVNLFARQAPAALSPK